MDEIEVVVNAFKAERTHKAKRLVFGWAMVATEKASSNNDPYVDTQNTYIPQDVILEASYDFMLHSRKSDDMHNEKTVGTVIYAWPFLDGYIEPFATPGEKRGFSIAVSFDQKTFDKFERGEYTGFSVGGLATAKMIPDGHCPECEKPRTQCVHGQGVS